MNKDQILSVFQFRHACKEFDPKRVISEEDMHFILETGRLSPSSYGFEPWHFVLLQNQAVRDQLLPFAWGAQKALPTASHMVLVLVRQTNELLPDSDYIREICANVQQLPEETIARKVQVYRQFLESDFELIHNERALFEWACRQSYIAVGNMMTSAAMLGIDSLPIEGFEKDKAEHVLEQAGVLDRQRFGLACMVGFGYRVKEPRAKTRRPIEQVATWVM